MPVFVVEAFTVNVSSFAALPALVITSWVSLTDFTVPVVEWLATDDFFIGFSAFAAVDFGCFAGAAVA